MINTYLNIIGRNFRSFLHAESLNLTGWMVITVGIVSISILLQESLRLSSLETFGVLCLLGFATVSAVRSFRLIHRWWLWVGIATSMVAYILMEWPGPANHSYVYTYICAIMAFSVSAEKENRTLVLTNNFKWLFVVVMLVALLQKVVTPGYLDGTINAFWLSTGGYANILVGLSEHWNAVVEHNSEILDRYYNHRIQRVDEVLLEKPLERLRLWGQVLSVIIVGGEAVLALTFSFLNRGVVKHLILLSFLFGVLLIRQETGFLSLLGIMGLASCPSQYVLIRGAYIGAFGIMQLLMLLGLGYL